MSFVITPEKFANGMTCARCGFNPETSPDTTNRLTWMSIAYAARISCLRCAIA
ncbi:MAG: hypothetical protein KBD16_00680 [Candidatus Pacebacteria bacterium]|nr:hypothetical protein [Candidatus Paceibacterota bacterium]